MQQTRERGFVLGGKSMEEGNGNPFLVIFAYKILGTERPGGLRSME